ncbi:MAG: MoxR family ATPase [Lachnospiraceae bacterium]|nr:MoxR family ATPase [Lachnospiraceae bacterium]
MEEYVAKINETMAEIQKVVAGKEAVIKRVITAILAGGNILLDDIPGVGKTTLALAIAKSMSLDYNRLQFTPDVLPTDITGFSMYNAATGQFEYKEGAIVCNLFLADEINRTSSKTQSALLEVMEENKVSVDGNTIEMKKPFVVIATQNPIGSVGTQKLPESQLDRFMVCLSIGYPNLKSEVDILKGHNREKQLDSVNAVITAEELYTIQNAVKEVYASDEICEYVANIVSASRQNNNVELGISPRGGLAILAMAKASAFLSNRNYVIPNDIKAVIRDVVSHRIVLNQRARISKVSADQIIADIIKEIPVPLIK